MSWSNIKQRKIGELQCTSISKLWTFWEKWSFCYIDKVLTWLISEIRLSIKVSVQEVPSKYQRNFGILSIEFFLFKFNTIVDKLVNVCGNISSEFTFCVCQSLRVVIPTLRPIKHGNIFPKKNNVKPIYWKFECRSTKKRDYPPDFNE